MTSGQVLSATTPGWLWRRLHALLLMLMLQPLVMFEALQECGSRLKVAIVKTVVTEVQMPGDGAHTL